MTTLNTKVDLKSLGEVELKFISMRDFIWFNDLLKKPLSDKDFVTEILFHQVIKPKLNLDSLRKAPDAELERLTREFIQNEQLLSKNLIDTGNIFGDFKKAIIAENKKRGEEFDMIIKSVTHSILPGLLEAQSVIAAALETLKPQIASIQTLIEQNNKLFFSTLQNDFDINEQSAARVLRKYKWFVTPSLPMPIVYEIVKLDGKQKRQDKAVNNLFVRFFRANNWRELEVMASGWKNKPLLRKRFKIIMDCLETIKIADKKGVNVANVVLPTLITQIDGLLSDYLKSKGIVWDVDFDDFIDRRGAVRKVGRKTKFKLVKPKILSDRFDDLANDVFLNILLQSSRRGRPLKFNFNRHKIIHGESVEYGRKDYVIRAFLILDFLIHL